MHPRTDPVEEEAILNQFLEGAPRADTWALLRQTLAVRLEALRAERKTLGADDARYASLDRKIAALQEQVRALAQEEAVSRFVEDAVRATLARPAPDRANDDGAF